MVLDGQMERPTDRRMDGYGQNYNPPQLAGDKNSEQELL